MKRLELFLMGLQVPLDFVLLLAAAVSAYLMRFTPWAVTLKPVTFSLSLVDFLYISAPVSLAWIILFALHGLYAPRVRRFALDVLRVLSATATGIAGIALYLLFSQQQFDSRFLLVFSWIFAVVYILTGRLLVRGIKGLCYRGGVGLRKVVLIGMSSHAHSIEQEVANKKGLGYKIIANYPHFTPAVAIELDKNMPDQIIFLSPRSQESEALQCLDFANEHHIAFSYSADLFATYSANMSVHPLAGIPIVELRRARIEGWGRIAKRLFDIVGALFGIIITSPIMLVTALIIILETGFPVLYKNERVGWQGKHFFTLKFRSMYKDKSTGVGFGGSEAEKLEQNLIKEKSLKGGPVYKIQDDPRVTKFGKFIRRFSIDELPQFFNVLIGNMSLVGPRPHQPREVSAYDMHHKRVLSIKPGITGLSQISGRSDLSFEDEVRLDVLYMERWSLWLDIIICIKTPFILFRRRQAL